MLVPLGLAGGQLPTTPQNLRVLPKTLSTDSVFTLMLGVADGLGVTCGFCHVGGDNRTWDSTNFASDAKRTKVAARAMFALVERLNRELLPPILASNPERIAAVTCMTCHRSAVRIVAIEDTLATVIGRQGADSAVETYRRIRSRYAGRMTFDLTEFPLRTVGLRLLKADRALEAVVILEEAARDFPNSAGIAFALGAAYEKAGDSRRAVAQYHKVLSIEPDNRQAADRLRALGSG